MTATLKPYDDFGHSRFGGNYVARCSDCSVICAYWDAEDLDENGDLLHECEG